MRSKSRKGKNGVVRWDYQPCGEFFKEIQFNEYQKDELKRICDSEGFTESVRAVAEVCACLFVPDPVTPSVTMDREEFVQQKMFYNRQYLQPTSADMKKTLSDIEDTVEHFLNQLTALNAGHPLNDAIQSAWYKRFKRLSPGFEKLQREVENFSKKVLICQRNIDTVYHPEHTNSSLPQRVVGSQLAGLFDQFGIKHSQAEDGPLAECIGIVLETLGHPSQSPHNYIEKSTP